MEGASKRRIAQSGPGKLRLLLCARWLALRTPCGLMSRPTIRQPIRSAILSAYRPEPLPISRTKRIRRQF